MPKDNKTVVREVVEEIWNKGNIEAGQELWEDRDLGRRPDTPGPKLGIQGRQDFVAEFRAAVPDINVKIDDMTEEGNRIVARFTASGTWKGEWRGNRPSGKRIKVPGVAVCHIENGKCASCEVTYDENAMLGRGRN